MLFIFTPHKNVETLLHVYVLHIHFTLYLQRSFHLLHLLLFEFYNFPFPIKLYKISK